MKEQAVRTRLFFSCLKNQMYIHKVERHRDGNHEWWHEATLEVVEAG